VNCSINQENFGYLRSTNCALWTQLPKLPKTLKRVFECNGDPTLWCFLFRARTILFHVKNRITKSRKN
jgi:hypothetical protein